MNIYNVAQVVIEESELKIPKGATADDATISTVLRIVFGLGAGVAMIFIIIAGIQFILSRGDSGKTAKARNAVLYAVIGFVLCMTAFSLVRYFVGRLA